MINILIIWYAIQYIGPYSSSCMLSISHYRENDFCNRGFCCHTQQNFLIINCIFKWAILQNWNFLLISAKIILHFYFSNFLIRCDFELRRTGSFNLNILFIEFKYAYYQFHYSSIPSELFHNIVLYDFYFLIEIKMKQPKNLRWLLIWFCARAVIQV